MLLLGITELFNGIRFVTSKSPIADHQSDQLIIDLHKLIYRPNQLRTVWVNPTKITKITGRENASRGRIKKVGMILNGDWDKDSAISSRIAESSHPFNSIYYDEMPFHQSLKQHFLNSVEWEKTKYFRIATKKINTNSFWHGCQSRSDLIRRCAEVDELWKSIREHGYQSEIELYRSGESNRFDILSALCHEVAIDIGRNGELLFVDGKHRLSIAKLLDLDRIPVVIIVQHPDAPDPNQNSHIEL